MKNNNLKNVLFDLRTKSSQFIEQMNYTPVGLGEKIFPQNCLSDKSGNNISKK